MNRPLLPLAALAGLVVLSGCAGLGYYGDDGHHGNDRYGNGRYEDGRYDRRYDDRGGSGYYRRVERDARAYADDLDRYLRISNREERAIRELLVYRTYDLLDRTSARRHRDVYPFPRSHRAQRWWAQTDREVERLLDRRYHEPYGYYNRYGGQRYTEYYRHRRYDARRGWYDTRPDRGYDDGRRRGRDAERARDRREDRREAARRAERQEDRRADRRRAEEQRDRRQDRREAERERDRRQDRRADSRRDRREDRRRAERREDRQDDRSERRSERRDDDDDDDDDDRERRRRGRGNDD